MGIPKMETPSDCIEYHEHHGLGYVAWHDDAEKRIKRGERQSKCANCCRYRFKHEACNLADLMPPGMCELCHKVRIRGEDTVCAKCARLLERQNER